MASEISSITAGGAGAAISRPPAPSASTNASAAHSPPSPCISVCQMDSQSALCIGCLRTIPEIGAWANSTDTDKRAVWRLIGQRLEQFS